MAGSNELRKCAACGAMLPSFAAICPECGTEIVNVAANQNINAFSAAIESYDAKIEEHNENKSTGTKVITILLWIFLFPYMLIYWIIKSVLQYRGTKKLKGPEKLKANFIKNFAIPNSRNDLLEFSILVESEITTFGWLQALSNSASEMQAWNKVWLTKMHQIVKKSKISMRDDKQAIAEITELEAAGKAKIKENQIKQYVAIGIMAIIFFGFWALIISTEK